MNKEKRQAVGVLRSDSKRSPADRARAKKVLGWKRTRTETMAWLEELLYEGLDVPAIADRLGVSDRYVRRLVSTPEMRRSKQVMDVEKTGRNPSIHQTERTPTSKPRGNAHPGRGRPMYGGEFYDLEAVLRRCS